MRAALEADNPQPIRNHTLLGRLSYGCYLEGLGWTVPIRSPFNWVRSSCLNRAGFPGDSIV